MRALALRERQRRSPDQQARADASEYIVVRDRLMHKGQAVAHRVHRLREVGGARVMRENTDHATRFKFPETTSRAADLTTIDETRLLQPDSQQQGAGRG